MILILFFGLIAVLVCGSAIVGFVFALYALRPARLSQLLPLVENSEYGSHFRNNAVVGLLIAVAMPAIAGVSYVVSGTSWFVGFFGDAGTQFWVWPAISFGVGFVLALLLRDDGKEG